MGKEKFSYVFLIKPIVLFAALLASIYIVMWVETVRPSDFGFYKDIFKREVIIETREKYPLKKAGIPLTSEEVNIGRIAWKYFENNYRPETGFVNSVDKYNATTLWDLTSSLMATLSAFEIGIIDSTICHTKLTKAMESIVSMSLYDNKLPNKVYNTTNLEMTTYDNRPTPNGVGWSSMDIGRFLTFCNRIVHNYPQYTHYVKKIQNKWNLHAAIENASLTGIGLSFKDGKEMKVQEGKLGYEEYCAKGFQLMGYDVSNALLYTDFIKFSEIYGEEIAADSREVKYHPGYNYVVSDPYILDGIEHGFDINSLELAYRIFLVQKKRYEHTKLITAVGETHIDKKPWFVYNSIYVNEKTWHCVSESGADATDCKTFSTAVAFGFYYLFDDSYSTLLFDKAKGLYHPDLGFYGGIFEGSGKTNSAITANVNGIILEALNYKLNKLSR